MSHLPYKYLPEQLRNGKGRIVHVNRNPKDLYVSMYNHQKGKGIIDADMSWTEFFNDVVVGDGKVQQILFYNDLIMVQ